MPRETKKAREAREAAERDAAEVVWHLRGEAWRRRRGDWWLCVEQRHKPNRREMMWVAVLTCRWGVYVNISAHLGAVETADLDVVRAAADAWLVEVTAPLMQLVADGAAAQLREGA